MRRIYENLLKFHLKEHRQIIFFSGPLQVGKTTTSLDTVSEQFTYYFNWDNEDHWSLIIQGPQAIAREAKFETMQKTTPIIVPAKTFLSQLI